MGLKYCVIGAGGTGGCIAAYLHKASKDVTVIARGAHLEAIKKNGLKIAKSDLPSEIYMVNATDMEHYDEKPDVFIVCVKYYSIDDVIPFIKEHGKEGSIVIPILNVYGTGEKLQEALPEYLCTDGCVYVASTIKEPGEIYMAGSILKVVFGVRDPEDICRELLIVSNDLNESGIDGVLTDDVKRDTLQKYAYISPMATAGLYYDACADVFQEAGEPRLLFENLMKEIDKLATAMGHPFLVNIVKTNLDILDGLKGDASTSMQRDIWAGKPSEIDGLVFEPLRLAKKYGVDMPYYEKCVAEIKKKLGLD